MARHVSFVRGGVSGAHHKRSPCVRCLRGSTSNPARRGKAQAAPFISLSAEPGHCSLLQKMDSRVATLRAVADTLLPSLEAPADEAAAAGDGLAAALLRHSSGGSDDVALKVLETVEARLPAETRRELNLLLRLLGSRLGSLLLMGRCAFTGFGLPSAFPSLPLRQREAVLLAWAQSPDARMRKAFKALKSLTMIAQFTWLGPQGNSPLLQALGYPVGDPLRPPTPAPAAAAAEAAVAAALVDLSTHDGSPGSAAGAGAALAAKGMRVAWPGDFAGAPADRKSVV